MKNMEIFLLVTFAIGFLVWRRFYSVSKAAKNNYGTSTSTAPAAVTEWATHAQQQAAKYDIPKELILAQIWQESTGDPEAVGSAGERGLMQLKPIAIEDLKESGYGSFEGWDKIPSVNIAAGAAYLDLQKKRAGRFFIEDDFRDYSSAMEAYNEGYQESKKDLGPDGYDTEIRNKAEILGYDS